MQALDKPRISTALVRLFSLYTRLYVKRRFHSVRVVSGSQPARFEGWPIIVCLNHPSWWDPLIALTLAQATFSDRLHYAPMDSEALGKYRFFQRLGFFGVERNSFQGASTFLRTGKAILSDTRSALWITAEGKFTDVRTRPVSLRPGVGRLAHCLERVVVLPLAVEYVFWEERSPEALACWGEPIVIHREEELRPSDWTETIADSLAKTLDRLAQLSQRRDMRAFDVVIAGDSGSVGIYDAWRSLRARLGGELYRRQHGTGEF